MSKNYIDIDDFKDIQSTRYAILPALTDEVYFEKRVEQAKDHTLYNLGFKSNQDFSGLGTASPDYVINKLTGGTGSLGLIAPGISTSVPSVLYNFQGKGHKSITEAEQRIIAQWMASVAISKGIPPLLPVMTSLAECDLINITYGDDAGPDSVGLFQQRPSQGWGTRAQCQDPIYALNKFLAVALKEKDRFVNRGEVGLPHWAQAVQRSAFSTGSNYLAKLPKAKKLLGLS